MNQQEEPEERTQTVVDPEQVAQANRIRALLERRERCINALEETTVAKASSEYDESEAKLVFIAHLRSLIVDLYPLILSNADSSNDAEYFDKVLTSKKFGEFTVEPPESIPSSPVDSSIAVGESPANSKQYEIEGLEWFLENECPVTVTWEIELRNKATKQRAEKQVIPSLPVCLNAAKATMNAMQKLGIEAELDSADEDFGFDYDTIDVHTQVEENDG